MLKELHSFIEWLGHVIAPYKYVAWALGIIISVVFFAWNYLSPHEDDSTFIATVTDRCHAPPNVGDFVQQAISQKLILRPGESPYQDAYAEQNAAVYATLCANAKFDGKIEQILQRLDREYGNCFEYRDTPTEQRTFLVKLGSNDVCRAKRRKVGREWLPGDNPQNPILCIPKSEAKSQPEERPRTCTEEELLRFGWL